MQKKYSAIRNLFMIGTLILASLHSQPGFANTQQRNALLAHVGGLLSQMNTLVTMAQQAQDSQALRQVDFTTLHQDIAKIQQGIDVIIHPIAIVPRTAQPLSGDYLKNSPTQSDQSHDA